MESLVAKFCSLQLVQFQLANSFYTLLKLQCMFKLTNSSIHGGHSIPFSCMQLIAIFLAQNCPERVYTKPFPANSSLWTQPNDAILWNNYKCKDYSCLVSKEAADRRGFFKCSSCFSILQRGWDVPTNESVSAEFTIDEVLRLKPEEIRIGLDFSPTTGTFAAVMRERNVTIASSTLNLGAPFNEIIALRGLLPLQLHINWLKIAFDNTLDIIHSTLFLDGWIGIELQFVLFDWDRVLRPKGLLWIDRFFRHKEDMKLYLEEFNRLGYKPLLWRVVPKNDKLGDELFFSAVLEKPIRG